MGLVSRFKNLASRFGKRPRPSRKTRGAPARLSLETLEDRIAPAILTVNTVLDNDVRDAALTLREALLLANGTLAFGALTAGERAQVSGTLSNPGLDAVAFNIPGPGVQTIRP